MSAPPPPSDRGLFHALNGARSAGQEDALLGGVFAHAGSQPSTGLLQVVNWLGDGWQGLTLRATIWEPEPRGSTYSTNHHLMTILTQSEMRRLCVAENIAHAARCWRKAMLNKYTPPLALTCVEEDVTKDDFCRKLASSKPHPSVKGSRINTYRINIYEREMETYKVYMNRVNACKDRQARFWRDGLGIWRE